VSASDRPARRWTLSGATALPRLQLVLAAALFSTAGAAIKLIDFPALQVAGARSGIAALFVLLCLPASRRLGDPRIWLAGAVYAATMLLFVSANKLTTSANAIFLQATAPIYVIIASPFLLKERIRRRELGCLAVLAIGMGLFFVGGEAPSETARAPLLGNLLAALSGLSWAGVVLSLRWLGRKSDPALGPRAVVAGNLILAAVYAAALPWTGAFAAGAASDWAVLVFLGVFQLACAYLAMIAGLRRVPAAEASLVLMVEPVLNPVWSYVVHREVPGGWALAGGAVIVIATAVKTWLDARDAGELGAEAAP
jgi:drug/metabolite transporter (DMT)-like permease